MAPHLSPYHIWILDQLRGAPRGLTREQLTERFLLHFNERDSLSRKVFKDYINRIEMFAGVRIVCDKKFRYRIEDQTPLQHKTLQNWMFNTLSVSDMMDSARSLSTRVLVEPIPGGTEFLSTVMEAMKRNVCVNMVYRPSYRDDDKEIVLCPYCTRVFKQRWYVAGITYGGSDIRNYALDRVQRMTLTETPFDYPEDFDAATYFKDSYGIFDNEEPQDVVIKVLDIQRPWIDALPIHKSQQLVEEHEGYAIYRLHVRPTYDFIQQLLTYNVQLTVLQPEWLRRSIMNDLKQMLENYQEVCG